MQGEAIKRSAKKKYRKKKEGRKGISNSPPQLRRGPVEKICEAVFFNQGW
jgi:hypothetical protein